MAVSKKAKKLFNAVFETPEVYAANLISRLQEWRDLYRYRNKSFKLTKEQKAAVRKFFGPYSSVSSKWAAFYTGANGQFDPRYIPHDLYYTKIDQFFNNRKLGYGFNDKNYYDKIFDGIKMPDTLVRKINGILFDKSYNLITKEEAREILSPKNEFIVKPSQESGSGRDISFVKGEDLETINRILEDKSYDNYIFQELISQHPVLSAFHPSSINSIRICSLLTANKVYILSAILRMGSGGSRVDNATSSGNRGHGSVSVGINEDGSLKKIGYGYYDGHKFESHPDGMSFEGVVIPSFKKAVQLVKSAHPRIGNFRLVSWDIAIDAEGDAVLIESNMRKGSINFHQFNNGPLFENVMFEPENNQSMTKRVLDEVFGCSVDGETPYVDAN